MKYVNNPPEAASLLTSARSFGKYDLAGALSDLIDNSIKAKSTKISLRCEWRDGDPEIRILDNGHGMTERKLKDAMRPASSNPNDARSADDLGYSTAATERLVKCEKLCENVDFRQGALACQPVRNSAHSFGVPAKSAFNVAEL